MFEMPERWFEFTEKDNFIKASSNWEYSEKKTCSEKLTH